jgi:transposase
MILELHRQGLSVAAIARRVGVDRKTVRKYIAHGMEPPAYGPRPAKAKAIDDFLPYLRERLEAFPTLTASRLRRELRERGFGGSYTVVKRKRRVGTPLPAG